MLALGSAPAGGQQVHPPTAVYGFPGLGEAILLDFGPPDTIHAVFVLVREDLLRPLVIDDFALDITITSVDGIDHFHGTDVVSLSAGTSASQDPGLVTLAIDWTEDDERQVVGDLYTVCVQLIAGAPVGPERCIEFGPFF